MGKHAAKASRSEVFFGKSAPSVRTPALVASAAALAMIATAGTAVASSYRNVYVSVDGVKRPVAMYSQSVTDALRVAGVKTSRYDKVTPARGASLGEGEIVSVPSARPVSYSRAADPTPKQAMVAAPSTGDAAKALAATDKKVRVAVSRSSESAKAMPLVSEEQAVTIAVDGQTKAVEAPSGADASAVLEQAGVKVSPLDQVQAEYADGKVTIAVTRVERGTRVENKAIDFQTEEKPDPEAYVGTKKVVQKGKKGNIATSIYFEKHNGKEVHSAKLAEEKTADPVKEIVQVGTKPAPEGVDEDVLKRAGEGQATPEDAQRIAASMVAERGWGADQTACLINLWNKESHWDVNAENASSGAYGIPQSLPGSKMAAAGEDWPTNPATQIKWGLGYIAGRYGNPCGAWSHSQAVNWY